MIIQREDEVRVSGKEDGKSMEESLYMFGMEVLNIGMEAGGKRVCRKNNCKNVKIWSTKEEYQQSYWT